MNNVYLTIDSEKSEVIPILRKFIEQQVVNKSPFNWVIRDGESKIHKVPGKGNEYHINVDPLSSVGFNKGDFRIISLTERLQAEDRLLIPPEYREKKLPTLVKELDIFTFEERSKAQFQSLLPEGRSAKLLDSKGDLKQLLKSGAGGIVVPWWYPTTDFQSAGWRVDILHPSEFIPEAGSGVWAISDDGSSPDELVEALKKIHHPATAVITNSERKIKRACEKEGRNLCGVFLDRPSEDKYQLYICIRDPESNGVEYIDYPTGTTASIASEGIELINRYFEEYK